MPITLTQADITAIERGDSAFLNDKGAKYYAKEDYATAIEYYRLAAAMGCEESIGNLGYCYMYARSIEKNMSLAVAYFKIAAGRNNVDALYKLGTIYESGADGVEKNEELAFYYYNLGVCELEDYPEEYRQRFPSLYLRVGKAKMNDGILPCDLVGARKYLKTALRGFTLEKDQGIKYHLKQLDETIELLATIGEYCSYDEEDE